MKTIILTFSTVLLCAACGDGGGKGDDADADADVPAETEVPPDVQPDVPDADGPDGSDPDAEAPDTADLHDPDIPEDVVDEEIVITGTAYYVDSVAGSDGNPGTSEDLPWQTFGPVDDRDFQPGDGVFFKRGSVWTETLRIDDSGSEGSPIVFAAYGEGDRPVVSTPGWGHDWSNCIYIDASWTVVQDFLVRDTHQSGVYVAEGSDHNIVRNVEATDTGFGISIGGQYNLATGNFIHDLHLINNTEGGDDDYGAVGIAVSSSNNEISYNTMVNCIGPSYDYGTDGGVVEWYGEIENTNVHHNRGESSNGFLEVGGGSAHNITVAYNVSVDNGGFAWLHAEGTFAADIRNFKVESNTIVETAELDENHWAAFGFTGSPPPGEFQIRNNIFYLNDFWVVTAIDERGWDIVHENNLYYVANTDGEIGFAPAAGEVAADPLFVDTLGWDFHLQAGSPARNAGADLGYTLDFENLPVPAGAAPDIGAFEYQD
jgi:hypothetical protein